MRMKKRGLTLAVVAVVTFGLLALPTPAGSAPTDADIVFRFNGEASVNGNQNKGIFLPGLDTTGQTSWTWSFTTLSAGGSCDSGGKSGTSSSNVGSCTFTGGGPLLKDLFDAPHCGNSAGTGTGNFVDHAGRTWSGPVKWDGVLNISPVALPPPLNQVIGQGDVGYSLGSQLLLTGVLTSGSPGSMTGDVIFLVNAQGGTNCVPAISPNGAKTFTVNSVGVLRSR